MVSPLLYEPRSCANPFAFINDFQRKKYRKFYLQIRNKSNCNQLNFCFSTHIQNFMKRMARAFLVSIFPLSVKHGITPIGAR